MLIEYDTRKRFGCHGKIEILIEQAQPELFSTIASELAARRSCTVVTTPRGSFIAPASTADDRSLPNEHGDFRFVQEVHPPIRLLILGEGPDSVPLRKFSELLGWQCIEMNDASAFTFEPDEWTAAIVKSHNFGRDFAGLAKLLPPRIRYVGLIGPKKRRDELLNELLAIGIPINSGFFAPAGLDLNAETPEEIALAIVAEVQRVFAGGSAQSLRDRKQPIHYKSSTANLESTIECQTSQR